MISGYIPYGKHNITESDINAVINVLKSDFLTQGSLVAKFEESVCKYVDSKFSTSTNSATSALHIACIALGLDKDDWLWTSPNSFAASANCGLYCGARIDFVDIDPKTYNMCVDSLEQKLAKAKKGGKLPKIVVPVHFAGQSCDMAKIYELSKKYSFKIIEDASHAIGGKYLDKLIGNCEYSDITVFSFHPVKIITTAEGGMATTNSKELFEKMQMLRSHYITRDQRKMTGKSEGDWYYQQIGLGFNYRITELQAALGISQIQRIDKFISKRHYLKERYDSLLDKLPIIKPYQHKDNYSALHLYPIQLCTRKSSKDRAYVFNKLVKNNIGVNVHYIPIHRQPYYENLGFKKGDFPNAEQYYNNAISLPLFYDMTDKQQDKVVKVITDALS